MKLFGLNYVKVSMNSTTYFSLILGVSSLIYGPKAVQFQSRITNRWKVYWDLINRSKKAKKEGDQTYSQQLRNLSKTHLKSALKMERRRRWFSFAALLVIGGTYGILSAVGVITD